MEGRAALFFLLCFFAVASTQQINIPGNSKCANSNGKCSSCHITCDNNAPPCCGNGVCEPEKDESCETCPGDCGECPTCDGVCGNHLCEVNENGCNCPQDCGPCCCDGKCQFPENFIQCPGECGGALQVRTIDADTGVGMGLVNVTCYSHRASTSSLTDALGDLVIGSLEPSDYTCTANAPGYFPNSGHSVVTPGGKVYVPSIIPLKKFSRGTISGYIRHVSLRSILQGAQVTCSTEGDTKIAPANNHGIYTLLNLAPGFWQCWAGGNGFLPTPLVALDLKAGDNQKIDFDLQPLPAVLQISVTDLVKQGNLQGVNVTCTDAQTQAVLGPFETNSDGVVTFPEISAERGANVYRCAFSVGSYIVASKTFFLERGKVTSGRVTLIPKPN